MTSVHISQHTLSPTSLSPSAAEEFRRRRSPRDKNNTSRSRSSSPPSLVRFHYEVGVVDSKAGVLNLIQVCCEVCVEGSGCCKTSVCCDAVCCQLHLPAASAGAGNNSSSAPKTLSVASNDTVKRAEVQLPRVVATSPSSRAGLASYPITARELMEHVARCCNICLESNGKECCKKGCCAISCCLVNVDLVATTPSKRVNLIDDDSDIDSSSAPPLIESFRMSSPSEEISVSTKPTSCGAKSKCCASKVEKKEEARNYSPRSTTPRSKKIDEVVVKIEQLPQQCAPPKEKCCSKKKCGDAKASQEASIVVQHESSVAPSPCSDSSRSCSASVEIDPPQACDSSKQAKYCTKKKCGDSKVSEETPVAVQLEPLAVPSCGDFPKRSSAALDIESPCAPPKEKCCSKKKCGDAKVTQEAPIPVRHEPPVAPSSCCDSSRSSANVGIDPSPQLCDSSKAKCCTKKKCGDSKVSEETSVAVQSSTTTASSCCEKPCGGDVELAKLTTKSSCSTSSKCYSGGEPDTVVASKSEAVSSSTTILSISPATMLRMSFQVGGMDCASCSKMVEDRVKRMENVRIATCSVMTGQTDINYELDDNYSSLSAEKATAHSEGVIQELTKIIEAMGYKCELMRSSIITPDSSKGAAAIMDEASVPTVRLTLAIQDYASEDPKLLSSTCSKLQQLPGVQSCTVRTTSKMHATTTTTTTTMLLFEYQPDVVGARTLLKNVEQLLGQLASVSVVSSDDSSTDSAGENDLATFWRRRLLTCLVFVIPLFIITYFLPAAGSDSSTMRAMHHEITSGLRVSTLIGFLLALPIQVYGGMPLYLSAYRAARFGHKLNIDALVALSTTVAFVYSIATTIACMAGQPLLDDVFFETSAVVLTVILLGRYLESIAKGKAAAALSELARMQVDTAMLVTEHNEEEIEFNSGNKQSSTIQEIHTDLLQRDDVVQVLPGARFPTDGLVVFGSSTVDEAMLTGEARPVSKSVGDRVYGSTVNQRGLLRVQVTRVPGENALSGIMQLVRQAQNSNPPIQRVADAVAAYFVPVILGLAVAVFVLWLILAELGVVNTDLASVTFALKFAIATLVVSCPCAVGLAVPVPVMVASGVGAKLGVLFKSGPALEALHKATVIVFDKTGTLTLGKPSVVQWKNASIKKDGNASISDKTFWWTVASAESGSEHVWARAMLDYARQDAELAPLATPSGFEAVSGRGIRCEVNGESVFIGNKRWMEDNGISVRRASEAAAVADRCGEAECGQPSAECCPPGLELIVKEETEEGDDDQDILKLQAEGASVVYVSLGGGKTVTGWVALCDPIRPEASEVIQALEAMKVQVWVLSGDAQGSTNVVAKALGIDSHRAIGNLLPGDKAKRVAELQKEGEIVAMIGDGINDAPALTQADIGLTVANGSDVAMGAADVVLMKDHLSLLLHAVELSRATFKVIKLNLAWAFFYNLLAIPFAVGAFYTLDNVVLPPTFAGLAELLSSLPVILFAIALKWFKPSSSNRAQQ